MIGVGFVASRRGARRCSIAALAFALAGFGNGLLLVYERLLIQAIVPDRLMARVFGVQRHGSPRGPSRPRSSRAGALLSDRARAR